MSRTIDSVKGAVGELALKEVAGRRFVRVANGSGKVPMRVCGNGGKMKRVG